MKFSRFVICFAVAASSGAMASAQNITKGAALFQQRCSVCHMVEASKKATLGPNLSNIWGKKIASQPDFNYSAAFRKVPGVWSKTMLDRFLAAPGKMVPGTRMPIAVALPNDRVDIIAFLSMSQGK